jgi:hypothetical protein
MADRPPSVVDASHPLLSCVGGGRAATPCCECHSQNGAFYMGPGIFVNHYLLKWEYFEKPTLYYIKLIC